MWSNKEVTTVFVRGLEFYGHHGVPDEEQTIGHRYRINIALEVEETAQLSDDVSETVDYGAVSRTALFIAQAKRYRTIERLARVIADAILNEYEEVASVRIRIEKPLPPAPIIAEAVGVEITLVRPIS